MADAYALTIQILQDPNDPIFDKPKLAEKYLSKPPFRFLHDIISAVQANTGFAPGLYSGDELDPKAIQDKEQKVAYLAKIINVVGILLGTPVPAKPLKIVAGLEPEETNVFLQMLGKACRVNNGADVVQRVLGGEAQSEGGARRKSQAGAAPPAPAAQEPPKRSKSIERRRPKAEEAEEPAAPPPPAAEPPAKAKSKSKPKAPPPPPPPEDPPEQPPPRAASPAEDPALRSSQGARAVVRPQSARKAPPKLSSSAGQASAAVGGVRTGGSRRGPTSDSIANASVGGSRPIALFEEGKEGSDDDVEVVHEQRPVALGPGRDDGEQGVLVKNILEAEAALKKVGAESAPDDEPAGQGIILKRLGKPGASGGAGGGVKAGDLGGIRELVQRLCQSSHPLAKSMDFLAEDFENMAKEYRFWVTERRVFQDKLDDEQRLVTDRETSVVLLADLDSQIKQAKDRIIGVKANILRNDETVSKLLSMAVGK